MGPQMANVQPAGSTGVGYDRATSPIDSPAAPLPPSPATTSWTTASTATTRPRARSVVEERRAVTGMRPLSDARGSPGHSASTCWGHPGRLLEQQHVQPPGRHRQPADDHDEEVGEVPE